MVEVVDAETGAAVEGANIRIYYAGKPFRAWNAPDPVTTTTDAAGRATLEVADYKCLDGFVGWHITDERHAEFLSWAWHGTRVPHGAQPGPDDPDDIDMRVKMRPTADSRQLNADRCVLQMKQPGDLSAAGLVRLHWRAAHRATPSDARDQ